MHWDPTHLLLALNNSFQCPLPLNSNVLIYSELELIQCKSCVNGY